MNSIRSLRTEWQFSVCVPSDYRQDFTAYIGTDEIAVRGLGQTPEPVASVEPVAELTPVAVSPRRQAGWPNL